MAEVVGVAGVTGGVRAWAVVTTVFVVGSEGVVYAGNGPDAPCSGFGRPVNSRTPPTATAATTIRVSSTHSARARARPGARPEQVPHRPAPGSLTAPHCAHIHGVPAIGPPSARRLAGAVTSSSPKRAPAATARYDPWTTLTIQGMPNLSTSAPNSSPHICFSNGTVTVAPSLSCSQ